MPPSAKPLPAIPLFPTLSTLSIDSRSHLERIILRSLSDDPTITQESRSVWQSTLIDALEELGESISQGSWLEGIKQRRVHKSDGDEQPESSTAQRQERLSLLISRPPAANSPKHLLLCVAPLASRIVHPNEDILVPSNPSCTFTPNLFPIADLGAGQATVLYGVREWTEQAGIKVVGGTFTFKSVTSPRLYASLCKTLRIAVYTHLSIVLEQHVISDSNVEILFPEPHLISPPPPPPSRPQIQRASSSHNRLHSLIPSGLFSIFSKKTFPGSHSPRGSSLDLPLHNHPDPPLSRLRRFSFMSSESSPRPPPPDLPFRTTLDRIESSLDMYSTCPTIKLAPPPLLITLVQKEQVDPKRRLNGDERAGLASVNGWSGKDDKGRSMAGIVGFLRHQQVSFLYSQHVPAPAPVAPPPPTHTHSDPVAITAGSAAVSSSIVASSSSTSSLPDEKGTKPSSFTQCDTPRVLSYQFFDDRDARLGEFVTETVALAKELCEVPGCKYKRGEHQRRYIHNATQITFDVDTDKESVKDDGWILMWQSCSICGEKTERKRMSDGTFLFSFSKFLELLVYSPALTELTPRLCIHTTPPPRPRPREDTPLPRSRFNILRHFMYQSTTITISLSFIEDVFEIRVPRLQLIKGGSAESQVGSPTGKVTDEDKKALRKEITSWFYAVSQHLDKLEEIVVGDDLESFKKALPRLPSQDTSIFDDEDETPMPLQSPLHTTPMSAQTRSDYFPPNPPPTRTEPSALLSNLRYSFQKVEQSLCAQLAQQPLNDIRRAFLSAAKGTTKRLTAWQRKHVLPEQVFEFDFPEPDWWAKGCHAVPGGSVLVREDDWGSIIAYTLGTMDYQRELSNMSLARPSIPLPSPPSSDASSFFTTTRFFSTPVSTPLDPDIEGEVWNEPEPCSAVISRKEHPRDNTLLSLRDVLRPKLPSENGSSGSKFGSISSRTTNGGVPPSAWAKPDVQVSTQAVVGVVSGLPDTGDDAGKILHDLEVSVTSSRSSLTDSHVDAHVRRTKASSLISTESNVTIGPEEKEKSTPPTPPTPPPKDLTESPSTTQSPSTFMSLTSSLANAMRYVMSNGIDHPSRVSSPLARAHHGLLAMDAIQIDERPHIKYDWTIGKRLKFSCTVYYAKQFDALRRRCGIDDVFIKSLSKSANWAADGGKSRSNFWKTSDDRFIIKTLVNAWNVADLQVLLDLAPYYFRYVESTASKPTVLAKLMGFYTIEVRNLETGAVQSKADLLVMENLFYDQRIVKTFDLKGIQGRKVKANAQTSKTLFDGEWIEGQQRTLTLIRPHSKVVLREAIRSDADFLAKSNIMDYSLLLGVDEEQKQIACGLVDTIGSYTFSKTLEYKAKQGLNAGKEVTVIPPQEYQERFVNALERYFLPCPDKWTKPVDETLVMTDPDLLPSVL